MPKGQKTKAVHWLTLIDEWKQSNLNKKEFCLSKAINYKNFTKWYSRLISPRKMESEMGAKSSPAISSLFVPVEIKSAEKLNSSTKPLVLILNKQLQLQIPIESVDVPLLNILFKSLEVLPC